MYMIALHFIISDSSNHLHMLWMAIRGGIILGENGLRLQYLQNYKQHWRIDTL